MYVEIHSKSEVDDESAGKRMWVNVDTPKIEMLSSSPKHLGFPPWHIEITADQYFEYSNGSMSDGYGYKAVVRKLEVQLTPADISALLKVALASGLLQLSTIPEGWTPPT